MPVGFEEKSRNADVLTNSSRDWICYDGINRPVLARVSPDARRLLDLGCGTGELGKHLKTQPNREVIGITHNDREAALAKAHLDQVIIADLDNYDFSSLGSFDCIICSHVLEHLVFPQRIIERLRPQLSPGGELIVAIPNVLHWKQRLQFLMGRFRYTKGGIMDETHLHFFDWLSCSQLVRDARYSIIERFADGNFPQPIIRALIPTVAKKIDALACSVMPGVFGWQFIIVAGPNQRADGDGRESI